MAEECSEVSQRITKALRFGLNEVQPGQDLDNTERIIYEFNDLIAVVEMLRDEGVFDDNKLMDRTAIDTKKQKVEKYMKYAKSVGAVG